MSHTAANSAGFSLPTFREDEVADPEKLRRRLNQFVATLEARLTKLEGALVEPRDPATGEEAYVMENFTEKRTLDVGDTGLTVQDVANVLATFLDDLHLQDKLR